MEDIKKSKLMPDFIKEKLHLLTDKEFQYFSIMWAKYGVLNITSKPGVAKSAICKSIADKMGFKYVDIRLSMIDETDVGLYPYVSDVEVDGKIIKCLDFVVPRWAIDANKTPTIIHFEELNRSTQQVRNAALQILLERQIGPDFRFNDYVLMMSSGNLGDEDGTDVEEFDAALNNRLIHINHTLNYNEWLNNFANEKCFRLISSFIKRNPEHLYKNSTDDKAYATPRSWTMLSEYIICNWGENAQIDDILPHLREVAFGYIGKSAKKFIDYCENSLKISILDIINKYDDVKDELNLYKRDKKSELIQSLKEINISELNDDQIMNVSKFLKSIGDDEKVAYLLYVIDNISDLKNQRLKNFLLEFPDILKTIQRINKPDANCVS